ncbi:MAG: hypothetical protein WAP29_01900 [Halanaerobiales bacterium]
MGRIKNFFAGGNTPEGFYSFFHYLPYQADKVFILKGGPGTGKSTFMKRIAADLIKIDLDVEFHWCASDKDSLDGLLIPQLKLAFFDGTTPHAIDPALPGVVEEIINLDEFLDKDSLQKNREEIILLREAVRQHFQDAYSFLKAAKIVYLHWKKYYQASQNKEKYHRLVHQLIKKNLRKADFKPGQERHLFGSAITPTGPVNYLENLSEEYNQRIIIKGNPGTGKSRLIESFCQEAAKYGYFILYLHCPLEPDHLDGAIIPELDTALLVGTPPHYLEGIKTSDTIVNLGETIDLNHIRKFNGEILDAEKTYEDLMKRVYYFLRKARSHYDELEKHYSSAINFTKIEQLREDLIKRILP